MKTAMAALATNLGHETTELFRPILTQRDHWRCEACGDFLARRTSDDMWVLVEGIGADSLTWGNRLLVVSCRTCHGSNVWIMGADDAADLSQ